MRNTLFKDSRVIQLDWQQGILKRYFFVSLLFFFTVTVCVATGGETDVRIKKIQPLTDTIVLDTLSIIPGSFSITFLAPGDYTIDYAKSIFVIHKKRFSPTDTLRINYRVFPYLFSEERKHKNIHLIRPDLLRNDNPFIYKTEKPTENYFKMDGLTKNGSIARGISFGNNQDVVVNSHLNLQLSGKINDNIELLLAATDDNIPFQPDGNTQQLQEFDQVFIQLSDKRSKLIAGDFQIGKPDGYFLNMNKKAKGLHVATSFLLNPATPDTSHRFLNKINASVAISRGKFARNIIINGSEYRLENNQGPYQLRGAEREPFIIILSGTEKIYMDGELLHRGQENDYIIDYNTAQITFTAKRLITKDKRIVAEFQYSDKNYARSLVHVSDELRYKNGVVRMNIYSEQDAKDQPLQQELTPAQKLLLATIGDSLQDAITSGVDSIAYTNTEVLYKDSFITTPPFKIYVYSTIPDSARFRVRFSQVGQGNGNYRQVSSGANGRVFKFVPRVNGQLQGDYEPVIKLITPKQKQLFTLGTDYIFSKSLRTSIEGAVSNNNVNTFSQKHLKNDIGYAGKLIIDYTKPMGKNSGDTTSASNQKRWTLNSGVNYEYVQNYFSFIERYRTVEFERDWNRPTTATVLEDQHILNLSAGLTGSKAEKLGYRFNSFSEGRSYNAVKHDLMAGFNQNGYVFNGDGSYLISRTPGNSTGFLRHQSLFSKEIKRIILGVKEMGEENRFRDAITDTLQNSSYRFWEWEAFATTSDSLKNKLTLSYKQRTDYAVKKNTFKGIAFAEHVSLAMGLLKNPRSQFNLTVTYRKLTILDTLLSSLKPDNTLLTRVEYNLTALQGAVFSSTFYEIGSGLELKRNFSYIQVPAGQGIYTWIDYNANKVKELNEFEVALFPDQAIYIKVYTPTNEFIKTYTNQFSQTLTLKPAAVWAGKQGLRKILSLFSNQAGYRVDRKTSTNNTNLAYNPFANETADNALVSLNSSVRNTLFFNQLNPIFGLEYTINDARNKVVLINGLDTRVNIFNEWRGRWNISRPLTLQLSYKEGRKESQSQFFTSRNFYIRYLEAEPKFSYQPNSAFRVSLSFRYADKKNRNELGGQKALVQDYGAEMKYNVLQKGSFSLKTNFIQITYTALTDNNSISFEMLEGLKTGQNITWGISYQRNLNNNMQISVTYDGRKSETTKIIHTGGAQIRAYF